MSRRIAASERVPSVLRTGDVVERSARLTAKSLVSRSPCCARVARLAVEDLAWARNASSADFVDFRRCAGCRWPYRLTVVGDFELSSVVEWTVGRPRR